MTTAKPLDPRARPAATQRITVLEPCIGVAQAWMLLLLGALIGAGIACCPGPVYELGTMYDVQTDLPGWEPDSGSVLVEDDELRIVYRDADGAEWELVYELLD